ncbi:hypothetical protein FRC09_002540 [Ceratobasidium sp. 395]|nr:hypothetical protein FRC09_002540 [Ceratobasidium sp. 395]
MTHNVVTPLLYQSSPDAHPPLNYQDSSYYSDTKSPVQLTISRRKRRRLGCGALLPTVIVFLLTSGLGIALVAWLYIKRKTTISDSFARGYLLVDEGINRKEDTADSATLRALTAATFISHIISATSSILMSLIAYRIAHLWIAEQDSRLSGVNTGPTPLQYGLMVQVLSGAGILSLRDAIWYLCRGKSRRATAPSYFTTAVVTAAIVYVVAHLVGAADVWLHATTYAITFNVPLTDSNPEPLFKSLQFNESYCDTSDYAPNDGICMTVPDGFAQHYPELDASGQAAISNTTADRITITLADENDLAVTVPRSITELVAFTATSFGIQAQCQSLNSLCNHPSATSPADCSNIGITSIPGNGNAVIVAPLRSWTDPNITDYSVAGIGHYGQTPNPSPNPAVDNGVMHSLSIYASCNVTVYNVTLAYNGTAEGGSWRLEDKVLSETRFANALISPYTWQKVNDRLATNLQVPVSSFTTEAEVEAALNQELARLALGYVSGSFVFVPAANVQRFTPTLVGKYPLIPLFIFVGLLVVYGLIAVVVFALSSSAMSSTVEVPTALLNQSQAQDVPELKLARARLLGPLPLVAQQFGERSVSFPRPNDADALSTHTSSLGCSMKAGATEKVP